MVRQSLGILLLALVLSAIPLYANAQSDEEKARQALAQLEREIRRINRDIASASTRKDKLQKQLREAEITLGALQRDIRTTRTAMAASERELAGFETQRAQLEESRAAQQARTRGTRAEQQQVSSRHAWQVAMPARR